MKKVKENFKFKKNKRFIIGPNSAISLSANGGTDCGPRGRSIIAEIGQPTEPICWSGCHFHHKYYQFGS